MARLIPSIAPALGRLGAVLLVLMISPLPARAAQRVELRTSPVAQGASITLADLFALPKGTAAETVVAHAPAAGSQAVLEADQVQRLARSAGLDWSNAQGLHRIIVGSVGSPPAAVTAYSGSRALSPAGHPGLRLAARSSPQPEGGDEVLVYTRNIMVGELISATDLQWSDRAVSDSESLGNPDQAIGKAARRPLRSGGPVQVHDLASPKVIHRDETVSVAYESDGVTLTLEARAMADGCVGDVLQLVNPQSKKLIQAVVSGPGAAVVGPRADALRAAAFDPDLRTASIR